MHGISFGEKVSGQLSQVLFPQANCKNQKEEMLIFFDWLFSFTTLTIDFTRWSLVMKTKGRCYCGIISYEIEEQAEASFEKLNINLQEIDYFINFIKNSERGVTR